jgi:hypothetical protein
MKPWATRAKSLLAKKGEKWYHSSMLEAFPAFPENDF